MKKVLAIFLWELFFIPEIQANDPCQNYTWLPDSLYRGSLCPSSDKWDLCDKYRDAKWYRVKGDAEIITEQVNIFHCATTFPIWMKGNLPSTSVETNATVCVNKGKSESQGGCDEQMTIKVKKCAAYYVYYLQPPTTCATAYCFGLNHSCPAFEPCDRYYHGIIESLDQTNMCTLAPGWYSLPQHEQVKTKCHPKGGKSVWINSTVADPGDIVNAKICYQYEGACCDRFIDVQMKNCTGAPVFNVSVGSNCICSGSCSDGYNSTGYTITHSTSSFRVLFPFWCISLLLLCFCG